MKMPPWILVFAVFFAGPFAGTRAVAFSGGTEQQFAILSCDATCQTSFVTEHNRVRTRVNNGQMPAPAGFQPTPAPPLAPVSWDAGIAAGSQSWSDLCNFAHSGAAGLGENLFASAGSVPTPATAVASWEGESSNYTYAFIGDPVNNFSAIGHYTQLVWSSTSLVGCGVTHCTTNTPFPGFPEWDFIVCRYSPAGNFTGQFPYTAGAACQSAADCNDNNVCTTDACQNPGTPQAVCVHTNNTNACSDGNACTLGDVCGAPAPMLQQTFDGVTAPALPAGWISTVTGGTNPWTTSTAVSVSAPNAATTDETATVSDKTLDTPAFVLAAGASLEFDNSYNLESTYDGEVVEIKIGAGAFTDIVTAGGTIVSGAYNATIDAGFSSPIAGRSAWSGASAGFVHTKITMPPSAVGQSVVVRFRVGSDSSVAATAPNGAWIDNVQVTTSSVASCQPGTTPVVCSASDQCHAVGTCNPASGVCSNPTRADGTACTDGNACTVGDNCVAGICSGSPIAAPPETQSVAVAADKATYSWLPAASATQYDVVRGSVSALPVGPGGGDEVCFDNLPVTTLVDATVPATGAGFWYLSRGQNSCGAGTFGTRTGGSTRTTTTCP